MPINPNIIRHTNHGCFKQAQKYVSNNNNVDVTNDQGLTALMRAAALGRGRFTDLYLGAGAEVNKQDQRGMTALMIAIKNSEIGCVQKLLNSGADTQLLDQNGRRALDYVTNNEIADMLRA